MFRSDSAVTPMHEKLAKLNKLDWRGGDCLKYFEPTVLSSSDIVHDLKKRIRGEGLPKYERFRIR